ncbi:MAG TPA: C25 family peptidase propeptide domain-containing protein, partial [Candidatus Kapabacteria bacterium]|nr:C25 family peptidase propeptide domain-containing protein [Candidatus Kapabacteria bacterium]
MEDRSMPNIFNRSKLFQPFIVNLLSWHSLLERVRFAPNRAFAFAVAAVLATSIAQVLRAQPLVTSNYEVLSVTPQEVILRIHPKYESFHVFDTSGYALTEMTFPGGTTTDSTGAQSIMRLRLNFLTPNEQPATVTIISQSLEVLPNIDLSPIPTYVKKNGDLLKKFIVRDDRYYAPAPSDLFQAGQVHEFRTAYSEQITISPIAYDPSSRSVTRVKSLTLRIRFSNNQAPATSSLTISPEEAGLYRSLFINGGVTDYYSRAARQNPQEWAASKAGVSVLSSGADTGQWLEVTTNAEGIYRITAQDLASQGITGAIDPNSIELFGLGGEMLNESVTASSGEWLQRPLDVRTNSGSFTEMYFYAPGVSVWKYGTSIPGADGVFHNLNPYTSSGHFLLKIGGAPLGAPLRVATSTDSLLRPATASDRVLSATVHENDHTMEYADVGREMLDQGIPRDGAPPLQLTLDAPGFVGGSSPLLRVAWDAKIGASYPAPPELGYITVVMNGQTLGNDTGRANDDNLIDRNWDHPHYLDPSTQSPLNLTLTFTSTSVTASASLDFIELVYGRSTDIGSQSIPFMLVDTDAALEYQFTNASGGEVWDVTNSFVPKIIASANGNSITADLQGQKHAMRRFIAFSGQSVLSPALSGIAAPTLRNTICKTGATEIIVAPQA